MSTNSNSKNLKILEQLFSRACGILFIPLHVLYYFDERRTPNAEVLNRPIFIRHYFDFDDKFDD